MNDEMLKAVRDLSKVDENLRARLTPAAKHLLQTQCDLRKKLLEEREQRRKDMKRGARLTNHRIHF